MSPGQRRINVGATSSRCTDVDATLHKCHDVISTLIRRCISVMCLQGKVSSDRQQVRGYIDLILTGRMFYIVWRCRIEPQREKTYLLTCVPDKDSNQPAHPRSLIVVIVVFMKKLASLAIQNAPSEDSDQTARLCSLI